MIQVVCYGVRPTEVPYFHEINKKFGFDLKLVTLGLNHENVKEAIGAKAIMVRGNCMADARNLALLEESGLEYVLTRTVGFDHVDLEKAKELGLKVARVPGYSPNAISELAVTHAMMLLRHTAYAVSRTANRNFTVDETMFSREIRNCTVGVLGTGRIGLTSAQLFKGLGANVIAYDVFESEAAKEVVTYKPLEEVLAEADIITVHVPYFKGQNDHFINDEFIAKMKQDAILVNTARGELQDIEAIIRGIESGKLGGYATDVLEGEREIFFKDFEGQAIPNKVYERLFSLYPKVLVTPHIGSYTDEALTNMIEISLENLTVLLAEEECNNQIV